VTRLARLVALVLCVPFAMSACASPDRPSVVPDAVELPTPMRSLDASVQGSVAAVEAALEAIDERLMLPTSPYRPAEPETLLQTPRTIRRVDLADPDDGYVVIYEAGDADGAIGLARQLADYLASGFGQTNYAADTQFSVSTLGDTVIFTTWSQRRSDDPERARAAFEAIGAVGSPVPITK
jgi:hypothetical protein